MQSGLSFVVFGTVAFSVVISLLLLITNGEASLYDTIGEGGFSRGGEAADGASLPVADSPAGRAEREREIRQMLSARSERLVRSGQPALDIDAEVARLVEPTRAAEHEPGLVEEVRQLVVARNERRVRKGQPPLDVDAEVARTLEELEP